MTRFIIFLSLLLAITKVFANEDHPADRVSVNDKGIRTIPGAYIFEFEGREDSSEFYALLETVGATHMKLNYKLFNGVSVRLDDANLDKSEASVANWIKISTVKNMWPVQIADAASINDFQHATNKLRAPSSLPENPLPLKGAQKESKPFTRHALNTTNQPYSPHVMIQVDKLHSEGLRGKGTRIAIISSGIDYTHPALGGCFGDGCVVGFGTDFVGDDYNGLNAPVPDSDPQDCYGEGTAVAGIIAAQENELGFLGVAPEATIGSYRIAGCQGTYTTDLLIAALYQAYDDDADIIMASLMPNGGWSGDPVSVAVERIVKNGVPCIGGIGDRGTEGPFAVSKVASGKGAFAVTSHDLINKPWIMNRAEAVVDNGELQVFGSAYSLPEAWNDSALPLWAPYGETGEPVGCESYPQDIPDLSKYIVLLREGYCSVAEKVGIAVAAGARYVLMYTPNQDLWGYNLSGVKGLLAFGLLSPVTGEALLSYIQAGSQVLVTILPGTNGPKVLEHTENLLSPGTVTWSSAWGPTFDLEHPTQFGAPGSGIVSLVPLAKGSGLYNSFDGTAMASAFVAGVVALVAEARGTFEPGLIGSLLTSTANPQLDNDDFDQYFLDFLSPTPLQGGGLIQAYDAAFSTTLLQPAGLSFNDTDHFIPSRNFTITNLGKYETSYKIKYISSASFYSLSLDAITRTFTPLEFIEPSAKLSFSQDEVTIGAGESAIIQVSSTPPDGLNASRIPIWSGWITVNGTDETSLSLPYQGMVGSFRDKYVQLNNSVHLLPPGGFGQISENYTFILPHPESPNAGVGSISSVVARANFGSRLMHIDIVPLTTGTPEWATEIRGEKSIGEITEGPFRWLSYGDNYFKWNGRLSNGNYWPEGRYKLIFWALHIFGDESRKDDWDVSESPPFYIKYEEEE